MLNCPPIFDPEIERGKKTGRKREKEGERGRQKERERKPEKEKKTEKRKKDRLLRLETLSLCF